MAKQVLAHGRKELSNGVVCNGSMDVVDGCREALENASYIVRASMAGRADTSGLCKLFTDVFGPGTNKACERSVLLLKVPLTKQKELRTTAYNKFTLDLVKSSINLFTTHIQREQGYALIKAEYTSIDSVLKILKETVRRDVHVQNIPATHLPVAHLGNGIVVANGNAREIRELRKEVYCGAKDLGAVETLLTFEYLKFSMMEILQKDMLEQILDRNSCEMVYTSYNGQGEPPTQFVVKIYSSRSENTRECKKEINDLYHSCIFLTWSDAECRDTYIENGIFIRESTGRCIAFGGIEDVQKIIGANVLAYESHFFVDSEMGDFICGKKFGKTMKISRSTDCVLDVEIAKGQLCSAQGEVGSTATLYRFVIKGSGRGTISCYRFLLDEFPVELCFDLDRRHHKKIIGMKGMTIQKIMKKYNIYAKFMSTREAQENGFSGNVILKTPRKNASCLERSKEEILAMTEEVDSSKAQPSEKECEAVSIEEIPAERYPSIECLLRLKKDAS